MSKSLSYAIGLDIGTSSCKVTILGSDGQVVSTASKEYPTKCPYPFWSEQDPDDWYKTSLEILKESIEKAKINPKEIAVLCPDGQPHTLVILDNNNNILRPAIVWTDQRSWKETEELQKKYRNIYLEIGFNQINPTWTASMLYWIHKNEPYIWKKIAKIMLPKDYVKFKLTGEWSTDWTDAAGTLLLDMKSKQWSGEICKTINLKLNLLPEILSPLKQSGKISKSASNQTNIPDGTPVIAGACDPAAEFFGTGLFKDNDLAIKLATSGVIFINTKEPNPDSKILTYPHVIDGLWFSLTGTNSCASSIRWFRDVFCDSEVSAAKMLEKNSYDLMDDEAGDTSIGADGLFYHPYLLGERSPYWDPNLRASFTGIKMHHSKKHFIRAVLEGVSFSIKDCLNLLNDIFSKVNIQNSNNYNGGKEKNIPGQRLFNEAILLGGGSKSRIWSQILTDILGINLLKPANVDASFGSALIGSVGIKLFDTPEEAVKKCIKADEKFYPENNNFLFYQKLFPIYNRIHNSLENIYKEISFLNTLYK